MIDDGISHMGPLVATDRHPHTEQIVGPAV
jgi:hypothetical protein